MTLQQLQGRLESLNLWPMHQQMVMRAYNLAVAGAEVRTAANAVIEAFNTSEDEQVIEALQTIYDLKVAEHQALIDELEGLQEGAAVSNPTA